jgi:EmrB/QacA subfamily drug resistance transporter
MRNSLRSFDLRHACRMLRTRSPSPGGRDHSGRSARLARRSPRTKGKDLGNARSGSAGASQRRGLLLIIVCSAQLVLAVDVTVVNVANASIERALHFSAGNLDWTVAAYSLTFGGFLLLGGRLADILDPRRLFLGGVVCFGLSSLAAGASHSSVELVSCRAVQGACAAIISPTVLKMVAGAFPEGRPRRLAYSVWAISGSVGGLIGFVLGGLIATTLGWRWIFFINGPIAIMVVAAALLGVRPTARTCGSLRDLDVLGAVTGTLGLGLLIYGLGEAQSTGWVAVPTLCAFAASPVMLTAFIMVERNAPHPLVPLGLIRRRESAGYLILILQQSVATAAVFLTPLYMQQVWHYSAEFAGLATIPGPIAFAIGSQLSSRLLARVGLKTIVLAGFLCTASGSLVLSAVPLNRAYLTSILPALVVRAIGQGLIVIPVLDLVTSGVDERDRGVAGGLYNMSQQLGGAVGLAAIAAVAAAAASPRGQVVAAQAHGTRSAFMVCLAVACAGAVVTIWALRKSPRESDKERSAGLVASDRRDVA